MRINSNQGFTLIELMIVVAIIGILSAIAVPSFIHMYYVAKNKDRATRGLAPLHDPTEQTVTTTGCGGDVKGITVDDKYVYTLYLSGCIDKKPK